MRERTLISRFSIFVLAVFAIGFSLFPTGAAAQEYNARDEFSLTQGGTSGVWNYGYTASDTSNNFIQYTASDTIASCSGGNFERWIYPPNAFDVTPQIARNTASTSCSNIPPELLFIHPGPGGERAVLRWTAPAAGTFQISGVLQKQSAGATTDLKILQNAAAAGETTLFTGGIGANFQQAFNFTATVAAGDKLDFSVGWGNGSYSGDSSLITVTIGQPVTACAVAPANLQVNIPGENSPVDVQSINTNASLVGDATYTSTGKVGRAFAFDGDGDYVRIEDNAAQKPVNQLTIEGWFNLNSVTNQSLPHLISKPLRNSAENSYAIWYNGSLRVGYKPIGSAFVEYSTGYQPTLNIWNHYAFVLNTDDTGGSANTAKLYVNGVEVFSGAATNPVYYNGINDANIPHPLLIGAEFESNNPQWGIQGRADEISIYGRALSQPELFKIVQQGSFGKCPPANCTQPPNNLVSLFAGEQNALDSRSNNHGTLQNGATFAAGKVGRAFSLDGVDDRVLVGEPVPASLQIQNDISLNAWIYVTQYPTTGERLGMIVGSQYDVTGSGASIFLDGRTNPDGQPAPPGHIHFQIGDGSFHVTNAQTAVPLNQWVHISANRKGGENARIYYNGVLQPSTSAPWSGTITYNGAWFAIGQQKDINRPFNGLIDEVSVFNRSLTQSEVQSVVNADSSGMCKPVATNPTTNQIAWFSGDGDTRDFLGLNPNGILRGDANFRVGRVGQAFNLDGTGDYVEIPDDADHRPANQLTAEGWFKINSFGNLPHLFAKGLRGNDRDSYVMWYANGNIRVGYSDSSSNFIFYETGFAPNAGEFNHYALVLNTDDAGANANTLKLYVNGGEVFSNAAAGPIYYDANPHPLTVGADINNDVVDFFLNGQADEVSLYSRALSASEIAAVYSAGVAGKLKTKTVTVIAPPVRQIRKASSVNDAPEATTVVNLSDATITFRQLNSSGEVSQSGADLGLLPPLPLIAGRFTGLAYDFSTTASYRQTTDDDVEVCFNLPSLGGFNVNSLRIYHLETVAGTPTWVNRTAVGNTLGSFCTARLRSLSPFAITELAPTAATVSLAGRATSGKRGVRNALVTLTEASGATRTVLTGTNGAYRFTNIAAGQNVTVTISAKRFTFVPNTQVVNMTESLEDVNFRTPDAELSAP